MVRAVSSAAARLDCRLPPIGGELPELLAALPFTCRCVRIGLDPVGRGDRGIRRGARPYDPGSGRWAGLRHRSRLRASHSGACGSCRGWFPLGRWSVVGIRRGGGIPGGSLHCRVAQGRDRPGHGGAARRAHLQCCSPSSRLRARHCRGCRCRQGLTQPPAAPLRRRGGTEDEAGAAGGEVPPGPGKESPPGRESVFLAGSGLRGALPAAALRAPAKSRAPLSLAPSGGATFAEADAFADGKMFARRGCVCGRGPVGRGGRCCRERCVHIRITSKPCANTGRLLIPIREKRAAHRRNCE